VSYRHHSLHRRCATIHTRRDAFSLVEIVVALAIVLVLSAVAIPNVAGYLDQKRIEATADLLADVRDGLSLSTTGFRQVVAANAGQLSELTTQIWNSNSGSAPFPRNSCGAAFNNVEVNRWDDAGPYVSFFIPATGLPTPIGVADDVMERIPNSAAPGIIRIVIPNVSLTDATAFDQTVDGGNGAAGGTIAWTAPVSGEVTLYYQIPIDNRC
jgi:prepilin-type N-terminal cleavage/methylation domain-containing protein